MSVASEINRIKANIADAYDEAEAKGATMPATENSANLADTIASISGGGIPIDEGSQTPLYFGVHASGFVLSNNPADETPVAFGVNVNGHPYVKGGTA
jgi:hypothetical protein